MNDDKLLRYNKNFRYLSLDTETAGLNAFYHEPWQIAWSITEGGKIISCKQYHLRIPNLKVSPDAARITKFDLEYHNRVARDPKEVYDELAADWFDERNFIVLQNYYFDLNKIKVLERLLGINKYYNFNKRVYDAIALSKAFRLQINPPENREDYVKWQFSMLNFKQKGLKTSLGTMAKEFGIEWDDFKSHEARYDVIKTSELFQKLIWAVRVY
jgi:DNA polymerase III epsilon subunit-like protein